MIEIVSVAKNEVSLWSAYLQTCSQPTFYHDYRWRYVMEKSFSRQSYYQMALEGGKVLGVLPLFLRESRIFGRSLVSMPFLYSGGILADNPKVVSLLFKEAARIAENTQASYIEMRHFNKWNLPLITGEHKVTFFLDLLSTIDEQWKRLDSKVRNQIRKSEKNSLVVRQGKGELLDVFYKIFCRGMRDLGTPVLGRDLFKNMLEHFPDEVNFFIIEYKGKSIACAFTLLHDQVLEIPWSCSIRSFNILCPNSALYWHLIKFAILMGCSRFDFGRCSKDSGVYNFKRQWGAEPQQLYWQYWSQNPVNAPAFEQQKTKYRFLSDAWKLLPLPLANQLGPIIARRLPNY